MGFSLFLSCFEPCFSRVSMGFSGNCRRVLGRKAVVGNVGKGDFSRFFPAFNPWFIPGFPGIFQLGIPNLFWEGTGMRWHRLQPSQTSENGDFSRVFPIFQPLAPSQGMEQLRARSQGMDTPFPPGCGRKSLESAHPGAGAAPEELRDRFPSIPRGGKGRNPNPPVPAHPSPFPKRLWDSQLENPVETRDKWV